jgi:hypothetical protein
MPTTTTLINIRQFFREREGRKRKNTLNKSKSTRSRPQQWTEESVISKMKNSPAEYDKTYKYQAVLPREKERKNGKRCAEIIQNANQQ